MKNLWKRPLGRYGKVTITLGDSIVASVSVVLLVFAWINFSRLQEMVEKIVDTIQNPSPEVVVIGEEEWTDVEDLTALMSEEEIEDQKEWILHSENVCYFVERNLSDLYGLLKRADICSSEWFADYQSYMERLEEQDRLLEGQTSKNHRKVKQLQREVLRAMEEFYEEQSTDNLVTLETAVENYNNFPIEVCRVENVYE